MADVHAGEARRAYYAAISFADHLVGQVKYVPCCGVLFTVACSLICIGCMLPLPRC